MLGTWLVSGGPGAAAEFDRPGDQRDEGEGTVQIDILVSYMTTDT